MSVAITQPIRDDHADIRRRRLVAARSHDATTACACELHTESGPAGTIAVLRVAGEIDMLTIPTVHDALTGAMDQRPTDLVVDLGAVSFCCVRGFALLADAAHAAHSRGIRWAISGMTSHLDRIASMLWPEPECLRYSSAAAAVTATVLRAADGAPIEEVES